jgi:hypothetical protein
MMVALHKIVGNGITLSDGRRKELADACGSLHMMGKCLEGIEAALPELV